MSWGIVIQSLLTKAISEKTKENTRAEIYKHIRFLPVLLFFALAPGLCLLVAVSLVAAAAVVQVYPQYLFPTDYALTLAGVAFLAATVTYSLYLWTTRMIVAKEEKAKSANTMNPASLNEDLMRILLPLKEQFMAEHEELKSAFQEFQTRAGAQDNNAEVNPEQKH